jgi:hypothetical protein
MVAAFLGSKWMSIIPFRTYRDELLTKLFGTDYGHSANLMLGACVIAAFSVGRAVHAVWDRTPLQEVEVMCFSLALGLFCGAKLAIADMKGKRPQ